MSDVRCQLVFNAFLINFVPLRQGDEERSNGGGGLKQLTLLSLNRKVRPRLSPRFRLRPRYR